jgi:hypothetical protein
MVGLIYPGMKLDRYAPPDPSEPEGCPLNPQQLESYAFLYAMDNAAAAESGIKQERRYRADLLQLIRMGNDEPGRSPRLTSWPGQQVRLDQARIMCANAAIHERLSNGMTACRVKPTPNLRIEDWGASYIAPADIYKTPLGEQFVVNCGPLLFSDRMGHCDVAYVIAPGLGVTYRFQPYLGPNAIPIDRIIEFDKGLRAAIRASLVKDYPWPKSTH